MPLEEMSCLLSFKRDCKGQKNNTPSRSPKSMKLPQHNQANGEINIVSWMFGWFDISLTNKDIHTRKQTSALTTTSNSFHSLATIINKGQPKSQNITTNDWQCIIVVMSVPDNKVTKDNIIHLHLLFTNIHVSFAIAAHFKFSPRCDRGRIAERRLGIFPWQ